MKKQIIIDCDTGVDDAQAILLALTHPDVEVVAITCVHGNVAVDQGTRNTVRVLHAAEAKNIPVYRGCSKPLIGAAFVTTDHTDATLYHGKDGLGDQPSASIGDVPYDKTIRDEPAATALCRLINEKPGELTVVAVGPLTNLAVAFRLDDTIASKIKELYIMGGAIHAKGNITVVGEFNTSTDPEATAIVIEDAVTPTYLMPWETCSLGGLEWDWHETWSSYDSNLMKFLKLVSTHTCKMDQEIWHTKFCPPDLVTMAVMLDKSIITKSQVCHCYVDCGANPLTRGQLIVDWRGLLKKKANITVCLDWDADKFRQVLEGMHITKKMTKEAKSEAK